MQIEGIPEGWELVRVGKVNTGEFRVDAEGKASAYNSIQSTSANYVIIRKIETPKQWRPFANTAEAETMWDAKLQLKGCDATRLKVICLRETGCTIGPSWYTYQLAFEKFECIDGTPFGVEVTSG